MSETKKPEEQTPVEGVNPVKIEEVSVQDQIKIAMEEATSTFKSEIAGLNRKNTELQESLKQKNLEGKTEEEKNEALRLENEQIIKSNKQLERERLVNQHLDSAGLPLDFAKRIIGEDEANIEIDIKNFASYVDKLAQEKADKIVNERLGKKDPESGETPLGEKEIKRKDFQNLSPPEQMKIVNAGHKIID